MMQWRKSKNCFLDICITQPCNMNRDTDRWQMRTTWDYPIKCSQLVIIDGLLFILSTAHTDYYTLMISRYLEEHNCCVYVTLAHDTWSSLIMRKCQKLFDTRILKYVNISKRTEPQWILKYWILLRKPTCCHAKCWPELWTWSVQKQDENKS